MSLFVLPLHGYGASFDCAKARKPIENLICSDDELSKQDDALAKAYEMAREALGVTNQLTRAQRAWLALRDSCPDRGCVSAAYNARLEELQEIQKAKSPKQGPTNVGITAVPFGKELRELAPRLEIPEYSRDKNPEACSRLLSALRAWQNVEIIRPFAVTATLDRSDVAKHFGACDAQELITTYSIEPNIWRENNLDALSEKEREEYGIPFVLTKDFRLYKANIDNDPKNSKELVIYGAGMKIRESDDKGADVSNFHVLDITHCRIVNIAQVSATDRNSGSFVGLIRHENLVYVFDSSYFSSERLFGVSFNLWTNSPKSEEPYFSPACHYVAKDK